MCRLYRSKTERAARGIAAAVALSTLLGACSDVYWDRRETIALGADDAVAANLVTQMVDPWPPHSNNKNIAFNGERLQMAVECYRSNTATPPSDLNTSSASYSGGGAPAQSTKCAPKTNAGASAAPATAAPVK
jgi:hypothetical protein